jgi:GntR family transcriptional regulator
MLNKNDFAPLYIQLQRILKERIMKGEYKQDELIPSETEMMKAFQTTRGTVRKAISQLVNEGLVQQIRGKGTYVNLRHLKYSIWNFGGFTDYLKSRNEFPASKLLEQKIISLAGESYFQLVRARGVKKENEILFLTIDTSLLPLNLFPGIDQYNFAEESLYRVIREKYHIFPRQAEISLSTEKINPITREILNVDKKETSLLKAEGIVLDQNGVEIEKVTVIYSTNIEFKIMTTMQ